MRRRRGKAGLIATPPEPVEGEESAELAEDLSLEQKDGAHQEFLAVVKDIENRL